MNAIAHVATTDGGLAGGSARACGALLGWELQSSLTQILSLKESSVFEGVPPPHPPSKPAPRAIDLDRIFRMPGPG